MFSNKTLLTSSRWYKTYQQYRLFTTCGKSTVFSSSCYHKKHRENHHRNFKAKILWCCCCWSIFIQFCEHLHCGNHRWQASWFLIRMWQCYINSWATWLLLWSFHNLLLLPSLILTVNLNFYCWDLVKTYNAPSSVMYNTI